MGSQEKLLSIHDPKAIFPPLVLGKDNDPITKGMTGCVRAGSAPRSYFPFPSLPVTLGRHPTWAPMV